MGTAFVQVVPSSAPATTAVAPRPSTAETASPRAQAGSAHRKRREVAGPDGAPAPDPLALVAHGGASASAAAVFIVTLAVLAAIVAIVPRRRVESFVARAPVPRASVLLAPLERPG